MAHALSFKAFKDYPGVAQAIRATRVLLGRNPLFAKHNTEKEAIDMLQRYEQVKHLIEPYNHTAEPSPLAKRFHEQYAASSGH